ncbi:MAG: hypothetical protein PHQ65_12060 [Bacteroidales bacterium]|nr:hypothetical protein [Bacteroidales bacterium]MDD3665992.1 hypothetical protein [Bacteroidales bacterium]
MEKQTPIPTPLLRRQSKPVAWIKTQWYKYKVWRYKTASERKIKEAKRLASLHGCKYIVINYAGKPVAIPKYKLKNWIAKRVFKKGVTIQHIEKQAIYITH